MSKIFFIILLLTIVFSSCISLTESSFNDDYYSKIERKDAIIYHDFSERKKESMNSDTCRRNKSIEFFKKYNEMRKCTNDKQCVVAGLGCNFGCYTAINRSYTDNFNKLIDTFQKDCFNNECAVLYDCPSGAIPYCANNGFCDIYDYLLE